jgi:hypothetical protein
MARVTAADRKKTGFKGTGAYPVATVAQALSAIRLRHHSKRYSAVLRHVARSKVAKNPRAALERAREVDRKRAKSR